jgi:hypothetical protein
MLRRALAADQEKDRCKVLSNCFQQKRNPFQTITTLFNKQAKEATL